MILNLRQPDRFIDHSDVGDLQDGETDNRTPATTVSKNIASGFNTQSAYHLKKLSASALKYVTQKSGNVAPFGIEDITVEVPIGQEDSSDHLDRLYSKPRPMLKQPSKSNYTDLKDADA